MKPFEINFLDHIAIRVKNIDDSVRRKKGVIDALEESGQCCKKITEVLEVKNERLFGFQELSGRINPRLLTLLGFLLQMKVLEQLQIFIFLINL